MKSFKEHEIVIVGGGTGGIMIAAQLLRKNRELDIAIIEPSETHYYQPAWTLVGAGTFDIKETAKPMASCMPPRVKWIKDAVETFHPEKNTLATKNETTITYKYLVLAPGIQINWSAVKGLPEALNKNGVCSVYDYKLAPETWKVVSKVKGGNILFSQPNTPIKCGGAPQKIMYLTDEALRKRGVRQDVNIHFFSPGTVVFGVEFFAKTLRKVIKEKDINFHLGHNLVEIDAEKGIAIFDVTDADGKVSKKEVSFSMFHVVPPMSAPDFVRESTLAIQEGPLKGWIDVNHHTLQHNRFDNVFAVGDAAGVPTAKTGSAIRKQAPVVVDNLMKLREAALEETEVEPLNNSYNGYSSCPLVTGYGKMVLAEFDYQNQPDPTFPFDQSEERYDMYVLKKFGLPWMYWNLMLKGKA
jgi:sulfide:quinone oxidoreductase